MRKMKSLIKITAFAILILISSGCNKEEQNTDYGDITIDNLLYGHGPYYAIGFSFELGTELKTNNTPEPDITVHASSDAGGNITGAYLDTPNLIESFALAGSFGSAAEASSFYDSLTDIGTLPWVSFADDISVNQVWVFKTREENYVKLQIKELTLEQREGLPYAMVRFRWRIQPDGTPTFPAE